MRGIVRRSAMLLAALLASFPMAVGPSSPALAVGTGLVVSPTTSQFNVHEYGWLFHFEVSNNQDAEAQDVVLQVDTSLLAPYVHIFNAGPCAPTSATAYTCRAASIEAWQFLSIELWAKSDPGARPGPAGSIVATLLSGGPDPRTDDNSAVLPVEVVVPKYADLAAEDVRIVASVGEVVTVPLVFRNLGPFLATNVEVEVSTYSEMAEFLGWTSCPQPSGQTCLAGEVAAGSAAHLSLQVRIMATSNSDWSRVGSASSITYGVNGPYDPDRNNENIDILLCVPSSPACGGTTANTGDGGGGNTGDGGGSTGAGGRGSAQVPGGAPAPVVTAQAGSDEGGSPTASPTASNGRHQPSRPSEEGEIAVTPTGAGGPSLGAWPGVAAAVLVAVMVRVVLRYRRTRPALASTPAADGHGQDRPDAEHRTPHS